MEDQGKKIKTAILLLIVLGALACQLYEVDGPWFGRKDYNGAIYGIISRNFVKHGYLGTRFGPAMNTGPVTDGRFTYYLHHPPLFYFLVSFSFHIFGVNEWSARLVPILFSIIALFYFFRLVRKIWGLEEAYYSTLILAFLPINLYFSRIVLQESSITLGIVWTFNNINVVWLVTNGGEPSDQTHILVSYVYEAAFTMYRFGWAAALSMVIFFILFTFTRIFMKQTNATEPAY